MTSPAQETSTTVQPTMLALLISPEAKSAYFKEYLNIAKKELQQLFEPDLIEVKVAGNLEFLLLPKASHDLTALSRLSFVQGIFAVEGDLLRPLTASANFGLHEDFVFGSKYRGKTNERLTQLLINLGLNAIGKSTGEGLKLLDPMCGRATSLLWAMRYGFRSCGIEQDIRALGEIRQNVKKWTKLHRVKHKLQEGSIHRSQKDQTGKFLEFSCENTRMKVILGDARNAEQLLSKERFDLITSDLPYGVQHFTTSKTRNPSAVLREAAEAWRNSLKPGGALVLAFNRYQPSRSELSEIFTSVGMQADPFCAPHRMSESIERDVLILKSRS